MKQYSAVLLWARTGMADALIAYEDTVLKWIPEHDGVVLQRVRSDGSADHPLEIQLFEWTSESAMTAFLSDPRRAALASDRHRAIARTEIIPVQRI